MNNEMDKDLPNFDRPGDRIALDEAARILEMSPELVLHRIRHGDLRLQRGEVEALRDHEAPQRQALADMYEALEAPNSLSSSAGDYPPEAIEHLSDLKPLRKRGEAFAPNDIEKRMPQLDNAPGGRIVLGVEDLSGAEIEAIRAVEYDLQREPDESDEDFATRKTLFDNGGRQVLDVSSMPIAEVRALVVAMGLDEDTIERRNAVFKSIVFALETGGITGHEQSDIASEHGLNASLFPHAAETKFSGISLDQLAALYDAAAAKVGWLSFPAIIGEHLEDALAGRYLPAWNLGSAATPGPNDPHGSQQVACPYYTISFPLMHGDEKMRKVDIRFKYSLLEALAHLQGMTVAEVSHIMGDSAWWIDLNAWVDQQWGRG